MEFRTYNQQNSSVGEARALQVCFLGASSLDDTWASSGRDGSSIQRSEGVFSPVSSVTALTQHQHRTSGNSVLFLLTQDWPMPEVQTEGQTPIRLPLDFPRFMRKRRLCICEPLGGAYGRPRE